MSGPMSIRHVAGGDTVRQAIHYLVTNADSRPVSAYVYMMRVCATFDVLKMTPPF